MSCTWTTLLQEGDLHVGESMRGDAVGKPIWGATDMEKCVCERSYMHRSPVLRLAFLTLPGPGCLYVCVVLWGEHALSFIGVLAFVRSPFFLASTMYACNTLSLNLSS